MQFPTTLLDYCTPNNTVIIHIQKDNTDKNIDSLWLDYTSSDFTTKEIKEESELETYLLSIIDSAIENVIVLSSFSSLPLHDYFRFFAIDSVDGAFSISYDTLHNALLMWKSFSFFKTPVSCPAPLRGTDGITMRKRIPDIIYQTINSIENITKEEETALTSLAHTIRDNEAVQPIESKNQLLNELFRIKVQRAIRNNDHWHAISWWLAENFQYLTMNAIHVNMKNINQNKDPFHALKTKGLISALSIFPTLIKPIVTIVQQEKELTENVFRLLFLRNLWGNKADLSMSSGVINQKEVKDEHANLLLIDNISSLWSYYSSSSVHNIVMFADNTGLEFLCDLLLMTVILYYNPFIHFDYIIKEEPVFVSDVTLQDVQPTLDALSESSIPEIKWLVSLLNQFLSEKRISIQPINFVCTADAFWNMPLSLLQLLAKQDLMISKGDANYRRLLGDLHWDYATDAKNVLNYLPCPIVILRTLKSNVNVNISKEQQAQAAQFDDQWDCSGKVGMIQFFKPTHI